MAMMANRRSVMTLYSDPLCLYSHQVRVVLAEKGVTVDIVNVDMRCQPEDLYVLNPYGTLPTLVDRDLVLYDSRIIMEYLDERFPHPPLMPVYPVARAECRRMIYRIDHDWYAKVPTIVKGGKSAADNARREIVDTLISIAPVFASKPYFLNDEFTLVDCWLAPLFWRLPKYGIELPKAAKPVQDYAEHVFSRESFQISLSEVEREIRVPVYDEC